MCIFWRETDLLITILWDFDLIITIVCDTTITRRRVNNFEYYSERERIIPYWNIPSILYILLKLHAFNTENMCNDRHHKGCAIKPDVP